MTPGAETDAAEFPIPAVASQEARSLGLYHAKIQITDPGINFALASAGEPAGVWTDLPYVAYTGRAKPLEEAHPGKAEQSIQTFTVRQHDSNSSTVTRPSYSAVNALRIYLADEYINLYISYRWRASSFSTISFNSLVIRLGICHSHSLCLSFLQLLFNLNLHIFSTRLKASCIFLKSSLPRSWPMVPSRPSYPVAKKALLGVNWPLAAPTDAGSTRSGARTTVTRVVIWDLASTRPTSVVRVEVWSPFISFQSLFILTKPFADSHTRSLHGWEQMPSPAK